MLSLEQRQLASELVKRFSFKPQTAVAYIREKGRCDYCGVDLVSSHAAYYAGMIDHLLPQAKYPQFTEDEDNYVLACAACNSVKKVWDPLGAGEDPVDMLKNHRDKLVERVRREFESKWDENEKIRRGVEKIISR